MLKKAPAATFTTPASSVTSRGVSTIPRVGNPSWPYLFSPHTYTHPLSVHTSVCRSPAATSTTKSSVHLIPACQCSAGREKARMVDGEERLETDTSVASWPYRFEPHPTSVPCLPSCSNLTEMTSCDSNDSPVAADIPKYPFPPSKRGMRLSMTMRMVRAGFFTSSKYTSIAPREYTMTRRWSFPSRRMESTGRGTRPSRHSSTSANSAATYGPSQLRTFIPTSRTVSTSIPILLLSPPSPLSLKLFAIPKSWPSEPSANGPSSAVWRTTTKPSPPSSPPPSELALPSRKATSILKASDKGMGWVRKIDPFFFPSGGVSDSTARPSTSLWRTAASPLNVTLENASSDVDVTDGREALY
mmetsp:Transcript_34988/g.90635  ORF Transcript_34988/g.90635 Transcript_34988/m.90635 type:complete len:358 (-) Transcript_34988:831-1904(-)